MAANAALRPRPILREAAPGPMSQPLLPSLSRPLSFSLEFSDEQAPPCQRRQQRWEPPRRAVTFSLGSGPK